ncbi:WD40-repeat-containing domain protein [Sporodiniella umbellata]|nr:WD40-repeat-containing domain protein [Sporodiniella umbellata]
MKCFRSILGIAFPPQPKRPLKKQKTENKPLEPLTGIFGKVDKSLAVQKLIWTIFKDQKVLLVARSNGSIQFISPEDGTVLKEIKHKLEGRFVGLFVYQDHVCACTSSGDLSYTPFDSKETHTIAQLGSDLEIMRSHPVHTHLFAIGGKNKDLTVYDLKKVTKDLKKGLIFQAKNVKNDFLDLQQPVWIQDLQFMNQEGTLIAVATHHHQFRMYNTKGGRRPTLNIEIGKHPIKVMSVGKDFDQVLFADTMGVVGTIDIATGKRGAQYKGFTGACTDLVVVPQPAFGKTATKEPVVVSTSLDRFLRVHETETIYRKLNEKSYLKQRLTCVLVDEDFEYPMPEKPKPAEEDDEELWESMELVKERKRKRSS